MEGTTKRGAAAAALVLLAGSVGPSLYADVLQSPAEAVPQIDTEEPSDAEIRELLVQESIARYSVGRSTDDSNIGTCACPYHQKWNEKLFWFPNNFRNYPTIRCGTDSEYVRPGGPTVFCYGSDVPAEMVDAYREHLRSTFLTEPLPRF